MHNPNELGSGKSMLIAHGKFSTTKFLVAESKFETIIEQEIYPLSWWEFYPPMMWPSNCYAGNRIITWDGEFTADGNWIDLIPSVPKSWEKIYGRN